MDILLLISRLFNTRECGAICLNPECNRKFATVNERNHQIRTAYMMPNINSIEDESKSFTCPLAFCNLRYRRKGWLTRHITQCHQASEEDSKPAPAQTTPTTERKNRMPPTTTSEFSCQICTKILPTGKEMNNHCYLKHWFYVLKGMFMNETTVGTTSRSSKSKLGLLDSGP